MSMCIAAQENGHIYLAANSAGLPAPGIARPNTVLDRKIVLLGENLALICTGGTQHWADVKALYTPQGDLSKAAERIREILLSLTGMNNQAHCCVFGFIGGFSHFVRIDKSKDVEGIPKNPPIIFTAPLVMGLRHAEATNWIYEHNQSPLRELPRAAIEHFADGKTIMRPVSELTLYR